MAFPLPRECSTTELLKHCVTVGYSITSGPSRTRTCEGFCQRIYSPPPLPLGTSTPIVKQQLFGNNQSRRRESNPQQPTYKVGVLPLNYGGSYMQYIMCEPENSIPRWREKCSRSGVGCQFHFLARFPLSPRLAIGTAFTAANLTRTFLSLNCAFVARCKRMTVWAQKLQVFALIIIRVPVNMMHLQWDRLPLPRF